VGGGGGGGGGVDVEFSWLLLQSVILGPSFALMLIKQSISKLLLIALFVIEFNLNYSEYKCQQ